MLARIIHQFSTAAVLSSALAAGAQPEEIAPIEALVFVGADEATFLEPRELVLGIAGEGQAKAYPIRILNQYEILNDRLGARPLLTTW